MNRLFRHEGNRTKSVLRVLKAVAVLVVIGSAVLFWYVLLVVLIE